MRSSLAYEDVGSGRRAVLLVHGQPGSAADWHGVAHALSERFRVVAPDRPGYGATGGPPCGIGANARVLLDLLETLQIDAVTVAGHSWGAAVALAMAHDPRVNGVVLVSPVSPLDGNVTPADRVLADRRIGPVAARLAFWAAGAALALPQSHALLRAALPGRNARQWGDTGRALRSPGLVRTFWYEQRALLDELPGLAAALRPLDVPSTVVVGRRDRVTRPALGRELGHALGARVVEVASGGHLLPQRRPAVVATAIADTAGFSESS